MNVVLGDLPTWNLADLYSSPAGTDLETDLQRASQEADAFATDYEGKIAKWWMPDDVVFVDEIPHTATGKIQKMALREKFNAYRLPTAAE